MGEAAGGVAACPPPRPPPRPAHTHASPPPPRSWTPGRARWWPPLSRSRCRRSWPWERKSKMRPRARCGLLGTRRPGMNAVESSPGDPDPLFTKDLSGPVPALPSGRGVSHRHGSLDSASASRKRMRGTCWHPFPLLPRSLSPPVPSFHLCRIMVSSVNRQLRRPQPPRR